MGWKQQPGAPPEARGCPGALPSRGQGCRWGSAGLWGPGVCVEKPGPKAFGPTGPEHGMLAFEDRMPGPLSGRKHPSPKRRERCLIKAALDRGKQPFEKKAFH